MFSMLRRTHIHPLFRRGTSSGPHISTGLTLDEASSAALGRMIVGCPQLTELGLTGSFESLHLCSYYIQRHRLRILFFLCSLRREMTFSIFCFLNEVVDACVTHRWPCIQTCFGPLT
jgi:hypothetical protein